MGDKTAIGWTDATWNPWHGCIKISAGCKFCYMYRDKERYGQDPTKVVRSKTTFRDPLKWKEPQMVFTCSWSDFFIEEADEWRDDAWAIIRQTPHLTYQILTKRPERILAHLPADWGEGYKNVWLGVSAENQDAANERVPLLLRVPAAIHFASYEPALEGVSFDGALVLGYGCDGEAPDPDCTECGWKVRRLDWIIVGGESGPKARPFNPAWASEVVRECKEAGVACFVKQLGSNPVGLNLKDSHGANWDEWPADLRVREFPGKGR